MNFLTRGQSPQKEQDEEIVQSIYEKDGYCLEAIWAIKPEIATIVDIGGHIGTFGIKAKELWPAADLLAFEPHPESAKLYRENLRQNKLSGVVVQAAVDSDLDKTVLYDDGKSTGGFVLGAPGDVKEGYEAAVQRVLSVTLESIFNLYQLGTIDLLKLDCEGSEVSILETLPDELLRRIGLIVGEYHVPGGFPIWYKLLIQRLPDWDVYPLGKPSSFIGEFIAGPKEVLSSMIQAHSDHIVMGECNHCGLCCVSQKKIENDCGQLVQLSWCLYYDHEKQRCKSYANRPAQCRVYPQVPDFECGKVPLDCGFKLQEMGAHQGVILNRFEQRPALTPLGNAIRLSLVDGPRIDVMGTAEAKYHVSFRDTETGIIHYQADIDKGCYAACVFSYMIPWQIQVTENGELVFDHQVDFKGKRVLITMNSDALGDTIAWIGYADLFRQTHDCEVHIYTVWEKLFKDVYPELTFKEPNKNDFDIYYAVFKVGVFDNDYCRNKNNWRMVPLQQVASDILGLPPQELKPRIKRSTGEHPVGKPYIAISEFSTFQSKHWNRPNGWQDLVGKIRELGYEVMSVSKEPTRLKNVITRNGQSIEETIKNIQHAEAFIGVSSGPSWVAWALDVPVVLISGATDPYVEMKSGCQRIHDPNVCHGCFGDVSHQYDRGNWLWCPRNKAYECTLSITPATVLAALQKALTGKTGPLFSILMPTHNRQEFIGNAVNSILAQDELDFELIIVDDGVSVQDLLPKDKRIRYYHLDQASSAEALNYAMAVAHGRIFTFQADDDEMLPGALTEIKRLMEYSEVMWAYGGVLEGGERWLRLDFDPQYLKTFNFIPAPGVFWRREAYQIVGGFDNSLRYTNDWDYWIRLSQRWVPAITSQTLVKHNQHIGQDSVNHKEEADRDRAKVRDRYRTKKRILYIAQHLSTGGLPQYLLWKVKTAIEKGSEVEVIEWTHASPDYVVQRKQIAKICKLHTFYEGANKAQLFKEVVKQFNPDVIHLQELPELWHMPEGAVRFLFQPDRKWKVIETSHDNSAHPRSVQWKPDEYEWVSAFHQKSFSILGVPSTVCEYTLPDHERPDRGEALKALGLDPNRKHVLQVGLFTWNKNQSFTFDVARAMPDVMFHFVGNQAPNFFDYWAPLMEDPPVNCIVWGERSDVDRCYSAMDAFIFPSKTELNPLAVKEALSWHMPVLMRNLPIYLGAYDRNPQVTFITDDIQSAVDGLKKVLG